MPKVQSTERFFDFGVIQKFGKPYEYGQKIYGEGHFGEEEIEMLLTGYGIQLYGHDEFGADNFRWGIYQRRHKAGKVIYVRENFYQGWGPGSEAQTATRTNFKNGMDAWKLLTRQERNAYNIRGHKLKIHGVNLFLRNWLKSH
jgi:hypothetical protein